ncbi:LysR family transcriptional regulator [Arsukibacterium ikkense]|uniref:LysR family transcriptional regulator n=1 Tax=Arsukibacterium ikkense TaxID=336831 RepID=A0A0M2V8U8_9GAMM|nr:HTH-type transcriptional regulator HdfR [Arsukibacterium ikkense]KKO46849.1 LysR family transcriptional regulator [Arsukibacterium ikkense]
MDTELLKTFLEVQRTRHFGKAAENLYLTQSAVSFRIRQLEQQLGVNLFSRYRNNIQLTAAGERLLPHAQAMLTALQRAKQEVALSNKQAQQVSIAATANVWDSFLLPGFIRVQQLYPELAWRAESLGREQISRLLLERNLDLAVVFDPPKVEEIQVEKLDDIKLVAVTSGQHTDAAQAIAQQYILVDWGTSFDIQHAKHFADMPPPMLRTGSAKIALEMLLQSPATAYLPQIMVQPLLQNKRLRMLENAPLMNRELFAATLHQATNEQLLQAISQQLRQHIRSLAA